MSWIFGNIRSSNNYSVSIMNNLKSTAWWTSTENEGEGECAWGNYMCHFNDVVKPAMSVKGWFFDSLCEKSLKLKSISTEITKFIVLIYFNDSAKRV